MDPRLTHRLSFDDRQVDSAGSERGGRVDRDDHSHGQAACSLINHQYQRLTMVVASTQRATALRYRYKRSAMHIVNEDGMYKTSDDPGNDHGDEAILRGCCPERGRGWGRESLRLYSACVARLSVSLGYPWSPSPHLPLSPE